MLEGFWTVICFALPVVFLGLVLYVLRRFLEKFDI